MSRILNTGYFLVALFAVQTASADCLTSISYKNYCLLGLSITLSAGATYYFLRKSPKSANFYYFPPQTADQANIPVTLIAHGIVDNETQAYRYVDRITIDGQTQIHDRSICSTPLIAVHFDDAGTGIDKYIRAHVSSLGQSKEIERFHKAFESIAPDKPFVINGISRGAALAINFIAEHNPTQCKGLILEAPFDSLKGMIQDHFSDNKSRYYAYLIAATLFKNFNPKGPHPIHQIPSIKNKELPILIIASKADAIVPWQCSARLYNKFLEDGFTNVYLLLTDQGGHAKILWGPDGLKFQNAVHAFKRAHGIAGYNQDCADAGEAILAQSKPSIAEIDALLAQ